MNANVIEPIYATIGANIRRIRRQQKISQESLAEKLGLARAVSISEYERGLQRIHIHTLYDLATIFGVSVHDLMRVSQPYVICETCKQSKPEALCIPESKELDDDMHEQITYRCNVCVEIYWQIQQKLTQALEVRV